MESRFIPTSSGTIHVQIEGKGEPVLLIHGYSTAVNSWRTWEKNIPALAEKFRVYALDLLGYGASTKPEPRLDAEGQAKSVVELLAAEKITETRLVGLSWGGRLSQLIVAQVPPRVNKLVLVDSAFDHSEEGCAQLGRIQCPTLVVWDEEDAVLPVAGAHALAQAIPHARLRVFRADERDPGADPENRHWSQVSHSREWNRTVLEFLTQESQ